MDTNIKNVHVLAFSIHNMVERMLDEYSSVCWKWNCT